MNSYVLLGIAAFLPVIMTVIVFVLDKKTPFGKLSYKTKQIIIGICFGGLAIMGTEFGIPINGAMINCRDAAVIISGLLFGAPSGIIAGVIGGLERWIAVYWGVGSFTRVACTVSTIIAGIYAALLRKFMFDNKRPVWGISLAIGIIIEVFHLSMVFITNISVPIKAMEVVKICSVPMILANGISVMLASAVMSLLQREPFLQKAGEERIAKIIQRWLLVAILLAFAGTSYFVFELQTRLADSQTEQSLESAVSGAASDIDDICAYTPAGDRRDSQIVHVAYNRVVGETGYVVVLNPNMAPVSLPKAYRDSKDSKYLGYPSIIGEVDKVFADNINGVKCFCYCTETNGYRVVAVLPYDEAMQVRDIALYINTFSEILVFAILFALIYLLIKTAIVNQIFKINDALGEIAGGNLDVTVNVRSNAEFSSLSDDINSTVNVLKQYIADASARIDKELQLAKDIQCSVLPSTLPVLAQNKGFDIYAQMATAKEVGGDFYDFYFTQNDRLNFVIADVSGKGIPAAMFMMRAKTELKTLCEAHLPLNEVFERGNNALCEGNDALMFVTAWQASVDLNSGVLNFVNAGHNPPLICRKNGEFEFVKSRPGLVLAGMEDTSYKTGEIQLENGDTIFLYTDGVTEATNSRDELYGEERLQKALNAAKELPVKEMCEFVKADVDGFVCEAPQFDDITMLAFRF